MRGEDERSGSLLSYVDLEARVGKDQPVRTIRGVGNEDLASVSSAYSALDALTARPRSAREAAAGDAVAGVLQDKLGAAVMERLEFDLRLRWFVGMGVDDRAWDH